MDVLQETFTLNNGVKLPKIGLGTWQVKEGDETYNAVLAALRNGYRHIDTAQGYGNEESVGRAIKDSKLPREDIFVTTKLESNIKDYEGAINAFNDSLKKLGLEYIDLFLIHAPWPWDEVGKNCDQGNVLAYKAMEDLYKAGKVKAIGVSNFTKDDIDNILNNCEITPQVNQIGYFIGLDNDEIHAYCDEKNIFIEAYSPLAIGYVLGNETIKAIADKYNATAAQICIRYLLQKNTAPLPKSTHESRIIENADVDFVISEDDMKTLSQIKDDPRKWGSS